MKTKEPPKSAPGARVVTPKAPPPYRPQTVPRVLQRKTAAAPPRPPAAQPKAAAPKPPVAPPAYRPQPAPRVLQAKPAPGRGVPAAPRAQAPPQPRGLQRKTAAPTTPPQGRVAAPTPPPAAPARGPVIQRLAYRTDNNTLYAPQSWLDARVTLYTGSVGTKRTIGEHLAASKEQLLATINASLDIAATDIEVARTEDDLDLQVEIPSMSAKRLLATTLRSHAKLVKFTPADAQSKFALKQKTIGIVRPQALFPEPNDLGKDYSISKVCSLISIIDAEGPETVKKHMKEQWGSEYEVKSPGKSYILKGMHQYYYNDNRIMYDDETTHMSLMSEWGYKLIHSGRTTWRVILMTSGLLTMGKKYIFDIDGHTVCGELKKPVPRPATGTEVLKDYIRLFNDSSNYPIDMGQSGTPDDKAFTKRVNAIYAK